MRTHTVTVQLYPSQTGQTVTAKIYSSANSLIATTTSGFTELGNGCYQFVYSFSDNFVGYVAFYIGSTFQCSASVDLTGGDSSSLLSAINALGSNPITIVTPVAADGKSLTLVQGDSYSPQIGTAITFNSTHWPDLTNADVVFGARNKVTDLVDVSNISVTVSNAGQATQTLTLRLEASDTANLQPGESIYTYEIEATIDTFSTTLVRGNLTVLPDV